MSKTLRTVCMLAFGLVSVACAETTTPPESNEREVEQAVQRAFGGLVEAARSLNAERYLDYFDKDKFTYLNEDGTVGHSFEEFGQIYRAGIASVARYESLEFDRVKIVVIDRSTVVLVNEYSANLILGSGDVVSVSGAGTQVWSNRSGAWKLVSVSSSVKPKDVL